MRLGQQTKPVMKIGASMTPDDMLTDDLSTREWQSIDAAHHMALTSLMCELVQGSRIVTHTDGHYIFDSEGNRILDGMAGLWCVNVGYGRDELVDAAASQMRRLPYYNNFFKTGNQLVLALSKKLAEITPDGLNNVFYANSGSEAIMPSFAWSVFWALEGKPEKRHHWPRLWLSRQYHYVGQYGWYVRDA